MPADLRETHSIGSRTREWMIAPPACPALAQHGIQLAGISEAVHGFSFVRNSPRNSQVLATISGRGEVLFNGEWKPCAEGSAYLTPPGVLHAYRALKGEPWNICWVIYGPRPARAAPVIASAAPVLTRIDPRPLQHAIQSLYWEAVAAAEPAVMQHCVELIHLFVQRATQPWRIDDRLWRLWEKVDADIAHPWTLRELAALACVSGEHLRRLCVKQTGRAPLEQVAFLRMRRAASLLSSTQQKVETISRAVGYENAFAFSTAFKRWMGSSPSAYRVRPL